MATKTGPLDKLKGLPKRFGATPLALLFVVIGIAIGYKLGGQSTSEASVAPRGAEAAEHAEEKTQTWTCSMHPQIQLPKAGLCPICNMDLIPLVQDDGMGGLREFTTSEAARQLMKIQTSEVTRRFVEKEVRMVGKIDFDETKLAYITSWVPGRIDKLYVDYTGVKVRKGDHMVYLYSPELLTAQDELRRAAQAVNKMSANAPDILRQTTRSTLAATRQKLRRWGLTDSQIKSAETGDNPSDHITIFAPLGGTVIHRDAQEGMYVQTGTRIYTIADLNSVWVKLDAYESHLPWIHYGQTVTFTTVSYPGEEFEGTISFIDPVLDPKTRTVKVRVNVPNTNGKLKPEMFVRAVVRSQVAKGGHVMDPRLAGKWISPMHPEIVKDGPGTCDVCGMALVRAEELGYVPAEATEENMPLVIPASAPLITGTRAIVYVEVPDTERPTFEGREIVLGARAGDFYIVKSGLREGEYVVSNGNFKIDSALQILAKPSMMTPGGGGGGGHDHGDSRGAKAGAASAPEVELAFISKEQLSEVGRNYLGVLAAVESGDKAASALADLTNALEGVDMNQLTGHAHMVWMEYAMRLKNDAVELRDAETSEQETDMLSKLRNNMGELFFGLGLPVPGHEMETAAASMAPKAFQAQLGGVCEAYLAIQDALATDDLAKAREGTKSFRAAWERIDMKLLQGDAHTQWMQKASSLEKALGESEKTDSIEGLRKVFAPLSEALWAAASSFGIQSDQPLYQAHCSMALGGQGARWFQSGTAVRNPYYGAAMLACGDIVGKLEASGNETQSRPAHAQGSDHK